MKNILFIITLIIFAVNPINSQTKEDKKALKKATAEKEYVAMQNLINSKGYMFEGDWANSQSGRRVNLISNPTFIKMDSKIADAFLPFFGTSRSPSYGGGGGIEFKGPVEGYTVKFDDKKQRATIQFKAKSDSLEEFDVSITVFGGLSASVAVTSSNRSFMNYTGKVKALPKEEK